MHMIKHSVILSVYTAIEEKINIQLQFVLVDGEPFWNIYIAATYSLLCIITDTEVERSCAQ